MIDASKKYRTKDGKEVRIYATDGGGHFPVHGATMLDDGWSYATWTAAGSYYEDCSVCFDLVEVKPRIQRTIWLEVYEGTVYEGTVYAQDEKPGRLDAGMLALLEVKIDCEEGEGLDV